MFQLSKNRFHAINTTYLVKLNYVGVPYFFEDVNLSSNSLNISFVLDSILFQNLDCYFLSRYCVRSNPHFAKCSGSEWTAWIKW